MILARYSLPPISPHVVERLLKTECELFQALNSHVQKLLRAKREHRFSGEIYWDAMQVRIDGRVVDLPALRQFTAKLEESASMYQEPEASNG